MIWIRKPRIEQIACFSYLSPLKRFLFSWILRFSLLIPIWDTTSRSTASRRGTAGILPESGLSGERIDGKCGATSDNTSESVLRRDDSVSGDVHRNSACEQDWKSDSRTGKVGGINRVSISPNSTPEKDGRMMFHPCILHFFKPQISNHDPRSFYF